MSPVLSATSILFNHSTSTQHAWDGALKFKGSRHRTSAKQLAILRAAFNKAGGMFSRLTTEEKRKLGEDSGLNTAQSECSGASVKSSKMLTSIVSTLVG